MPTEEFFKKSLNIANAASDYSIRLVENGAAGFFCANLPEKVPEFDKAQCETSLSGSNNAFIVLGRDRNASWGSGNGGDGMAQCGMIDLVAGRGQLIMMDNEKNNRDALDRVEIVGPMFHSDAARIYITQKAKDIDQYFGLKPSGGPHAINKSAVAAKADQVRLIGREKVRIYCGRGSFDGFETGIGETNSLGERLQGQVIELQVGDQELHPMVLGNKLVDYFKKKRKKEIEMYENLVETNNHIMQLAVVVGSSIPGAAGVTFNIFKQYLIQQDKLLKNSINTIIQDLNSIDSEFLVGNNHILSDSVYTT
jgi:hypothetical protein